MGYNHSLYGDVLSFAVYILFLPFKIAVLQSLHYNLHYHNSQNKENVVFFAIFSQKSCLKILQIQKIVVPLHRNQEKTRLLISREILLYLYCVFFGLFTFSAIKSILYICALDSYHICITCNTTY